MHHYHILYMKTSYSASKELINNQNLKDKGNNIQEMRSLDARWQSNLVKRNEKSYFVA